MTTWSQAHQIANLAAAQAHGDLDIDPTVFPIDVYHAIGDAGIVLVWRPLPRLFGMYVNETGSRPGILLNNGIDPASQRHTAAHELGHHVLGHGTRADLDLDPLTERRTGWTAVEKAAEAFASWFLMPRRAVLAALSQLGRERIERPADVYLLSLLLGTPYRTTVRHLPNIRLVSRGRANSWMTVPPNRIKASLDPSIETPPSRVPDVWVINRRFADSVITVGIGDRLVVDLDHDADQVDASPGLHPIPTTRTTGSGRETCPALLEVAEVDPPDVGMVTVRSAGSAAAWSVNLRFDLRRPTGIARRWVT